MTFAIMSAVIAVRFNPSLEIHVYGALDGAVQHLQGVSILLLRFADSVAGLAPAAETGKGFNPSLEIPTNSGGGA